MRGDSVLLFCTGTVKISRTIRGFCLTLSNTSSSNHHWTDWSISDVVFLSMNVWDDKTSVSYHFTKTCRPLPQQFLLPLNLGWVWALVGDELLGQLIALLEALRASLNAVLEVIKLGLQKLLRKNTIYIMLEWMQGNTETPLWCLSQHYQHIPLNGLQFRCTNIHDVMCGQFETCSYCHILSSTTPYYILCHRQIFARVPQRTQHKQQAPSALPHWPGGARSRGQSPRRWPSASARWSTSLGPLPHGSTRAGTWRPSASAAGVLTTSGGPSVPGSASAHNRTITDRL